MLVSLLTAVIASALPILRSRQIDIRQALLEGGRHSMAAGHRFAKRSFVVAEVALSLVLLSGAALLLQTLWHLRNDRLGFQPEHVLTITIPLQGTKLENRNRDDFAANLVAFVRRLPGTEDAAQAECTPLSRGAALETFSRSDRPLPEAFHRGDNIGLCGAGAGYAKAAGIRVVRGRFFTEGDFLHPNTLSVINETAARAYFPGEDPIGKEIIGITEHKWKTVVGVVSDSKNNGLDASSEPMAFVNGLVDPSSTELQLIVRSVADRHALESAIAKQIRTFDSGAVVNFQTLDETISDMTAGPRFNSMLLSSFALIALLMAVIGVYGVLTFTVTQRTHEIGIRMALGAARIRILGPVLGEGTVLVLIGMAVGLAGALGLTRYLKSILYGVSTTDPSTFLFVAGGLIIAALIAMSLPARKAASIDPMIALRYY